MSDPDATYTGQAAEPLRSNAENGSGVSDGTREQLTGGDTLTGPPMADVPEEVTTPPDSPSPIQVPTPAEEAGGRSLDERLAEEEPDVGDFQEDRHDPDGDVPIPDEDREIEPDEGDFPPTTGGSAYPERLEE